MRREPVAARAARLLHPGDVTCGERGQCFETLLGSCIAVVMTDPRRTIGAMCHIVHPAPAPEHRPGDTAYADAALGEVARLLRASGLDPRQCEAWVYGGGNMFPDLHARPPIGERSARQVLDELARAGVRLLHHDVGGLAYRKLAWTVGPDAPRVTAVPLRGQRP